ncbi:sugar-binding transcriptional regulator [Crassaminicella thermophila]|uniref:Sugar-binding transcriptional regulator n=1 Tax=Crassaminicella thermophila TaxID=2599308 RepID=A0A5C0SDL2_CRATE|nr:sugar-binding domain-containing protein [Crassaminicella thermophila]QEK11856.1 sugar-binding transcriptional regulator [Crassaminicella thermophila]
MQQKENSEIDRLIEIQKKIVPEIIETLVSRYNMLRLIHYHEPIGRRNLASILGIGERIVRREVNVLKEQGFIDIKAEGMNITKFGYTSLGMLRSFIHRFKGLYNIEEEVAKKLGIKKVLVVPGFYDEDKFVLREIGRAVSIYLKSILKNDTVLGITGGQTMAMVAEEMIDEELKLANITVVPARGGLGKDVENQANTIAAKVAKKLRTSYKLLHMPDNISKELFRSLSEDPNIKEVVDYIQKIGILVFGIGRADKMAKRRRLNEEKIEVLRQQGAVAEAFGYYFNKDGEIVQEINTVGVSLNHYKQLKHVIGAAAGIEKAEAIISISKLNKNLTLAIDEGLAKEILK